VVCAGYRCNATSCAAASCECLKHEITPSYPGYGALRTGAPLTRRNTLRGRRCYYDFVRLLAGSMRGQTTQDGYYRPVWSF